MESKKVRMKKRTKVCRKMLRREEEEEEEEERERERERTW